MQASSPVISSAYYLHLLQRHWFPASLMFAVACAGTLYGLSLKPAMYLAEGRLKFERTNPTTSLTEVGKQISSLDPVVEKSSPLTTETEVMRSQPVVQQVINQLALRDEQGKSLKYTDFLKKLSINDVKDTDILSVIYRDRQAAQAAAVVNHLMKVYLEREITSQQSQVVVARTFIERQLPLAELRVRKAEENLSRFKRAHQIVSLKEEATETVKTVANLQQQIATVRSQLADAEAQVISASQRLSLSTQQALTLTAVSQSAGVQEALRDLRQVEVELGNARTTFQPGTVKIKALEERLAFLQDLVQRRTDQVTNGTRLGNSFNGQLGILEQELTRELVLLENRRQGLQQQLASLLNTQDYYGDRANLLPGLEKDQRELERQLEAAQITYSQLLQKIGEVRVAENQTVGNAKIISSAFAPERPIGTKSASYLAAFLVGLVGAGSTIYILDVRDKSIRTIQQAQQLLGYPLLGVIPNYTQIRSQIHPVLGLSTISLATHESKYGQHQGKYSPTWKSPQGLVSAATITAAYRMLQTNLKFLRSDHPIQTITVTSTVPKEGKSTVSAYLAIAMAQAGRRVLIIDADLCQPQQHQIWGLFNDEVGLSNVLVEHTEVLKAVKSVQPFVDVLLAGVLPPNSLTLLDSQRMQSLLKTLSTTYDFIILDTPPLNLAADAMVINKITDGMLLVVRPGVAEVGQVLFVKQRLQQAEQMVLGQVINGVDPGREPYSHYYSVDRNYAMTNISF